jgi:hypothetical protein
VDVAVFASGPPEHKPDNNPKMNEYRQRCEDVEDQIQGYIDKDVQDAYKIAVIVAAEIYRWQDRYSNTGLVVVLGAIVGVIAYSWNEKRRCKAWFVKGRKLYADLAPDDMHPLDDPIACVHREQWKKEEREDIQRLIIRREVRFRNRYKAEPPAA